MHTCPKSELDESLVGNWHFKYGKALERYEKLSTWKSQSKSNK